MCHISAIDLDFIEHDSHEITILVVVVLPRQVIERVEMERELECRMLKLIYTLISNASLPIDSIDIANLFLPLSLFPCSLRLPHILTLPVNRYAIPDHPHPITILSPPLSSVILSIHPSILPPLSSPSTPLLAPPSTRRQSFHAPPILQLSKLSTLPIPISHFTSHSP